LLTWLPIILSSITRALILSSIRRSQRLIEPIKYLPLDKLRTLVLNCNKPKEQSLPGNRALLFLLPGRLTRRAKMAKAKKGKWGKIGSPKSDKRKAYLASIRPGKGKKAKKGKKRRKRKSKA